jgi:hypothetical protein
MFTQIESILPNTIMELHESGNFYRIKPAEGYVLHTKELDYDEYDEQGRFLENKKGYTSVFTTCPTNYNFFENPREIYAEKI